MRRLCIASPRTGVSLSFGAGLLSLVVGLLASAVSPAWSDWTEEVSVHGFVSSSYQYNFNKPPSGSNDFRVFDRDDNTFNVDVVELVFEKPVTSPLDTGFRFDLTAGRAIPRIAASSGLFRDVTTGAAEDFDLQQAFVSLQTPVEGLRLDFGKFTTHMGYEVIEGYDGYNDQYSRSLLFGTLPFTHTGLRATHVFDERFTFALLVVNGWDNVVDNNKSKSVGAQAIVTPVERLSLVGNVVTGPERDDNSADRKTAFDGIAAYTVSDRLQFALNFDHGTEANAIAGNSGPEDAAWLGFAGYARVGLAERFSIALRAEMLDDQDGALTGTVQKLKELTITPALHFSPNMTVRAEFRMDMSDEEVFQDGKGSSAAWKDSQNTVALNAVLTF